VVEEVRKIIGTYVDHQGIVRYPVGIVFEELGCFDHIYWLTSDEQNAGLLAEIKDAHQFKDKISVVILGHRINEPADIGLAQELSVAWMRKEDGADVVGYQQADLCLTSHGVRAVLELMETYSDPSTIVFGVAAIMSKLYCETYHMPTGCFFLGETEYSSPGDGWENYHKQEGMARKSGITGLIEKPGDPRFMIDLGYLSTDMWYRKIINHERIWGEQYHLTELKKLFGRDTRAAIKLGLRYIQNEVTGPVRVVEYDGAYKHAIDRLGMYEDYCLVRDVLGGGT